LGEAVLFLLPSNQEIVPTLVLEAVTGAVPFITRALDVFIVFIESSYHECRIFLGEFTLRMVVDVTRIVIDSLGRQSHMLQFVLELWYGFREDQVARQHIIH
jgi:hypothetical protein